MTIDDIVKTLKIAAAEVEWNYPLDYAEALEEAAKELSTRRWISVKEYLPYGRTVLATDGVTVITASASSVYPAGSITHWMTLPEPPEEYDQLYGEDVQHE